MSQARMSAQLIESEINSCVIPNSLEDLGEFLAICLGTLGNLISFLYRNPPEPHQPSPPKPSGTSLAICNLISYYLDWNPPEPHLLSAPEPSTTHQPSAPEPSGTLFTICAGTLRNFVYYLHRDSPEPHQSFAQEPSGTSSAICTGRLRNSLEPSPEPGVAAAPDRTRAILG